MFRFIVLCLGTLVRLSRARRSLLLENLVLRQQLAVLKRRHPSPRIGEVRRLLRALNPRERTLVFIAAGTGLRMSELFALKWKDVDFDANQLSVTRSIVDQVVGPCKTEASQKPVPLDPCLAKALSRCRRRTRCRGPEDWIFASPHTGGRKPYRGWPLMRYCIQPVAQRIGITKRIGWRTFQHTYSTLLRAAGVDIKVMQELLRHASSRVTMDTYTQAITSAKRQARSSVVRLFTGKATQVERVAS